MNHDEKTTELELPDFKKKSDNLLHVNFARHRAAEARPPVKNPAAVPSVGALVAEIDLRSPWVLRLLAVVFVLILSMLVL